MVMMVVMIVGNGKVTAALVSVESGLVIRREFGFTWPPSIDLIFDCLQSLWLTDYTVTLWKKGKIQHHHRCGK